MVYMDTGMYGIKKLIPTKEVLFVLDHSGALHKEMISDNRTSSSILVVGYCQITLW